MIRVEAPEWIFCALCEKKIFRRPNQRPPTTSSVWPPASCSAGPPSLWAAVRGTVDNQPCRNRWPTVGWALYDASRLDPVMRSIDSRSGSTTNRPLRSDSWITGRPVLQQTWQLVEPVLDRADDGLVDLFPPIFVVVFTVPARFPVCQLQTMLTTCGGGQAAVQRRCYGFR